MVSRKFLMFLLLAMLFVQWTDKVVCSEKTETLNYKIVKGNVEKRWTAKSTNPSKI